MGDPSRWPEAGDRGDGTGLRTPGLDGWSWIAAGAASSAVCIPLVQIAMLARVPLLFQQPVPQTGSRGGGAIATIGSVAALVPIGAPLVALAGNDPDRITWAWVGLGLVVAAVLAHAEVSLRLRRLQVGTRARRWAGTLLSTARIPGALLLVQQALQPDAPLPITLHVFDGLTPSVATVIALAWIDIALGAAAAVGVVTLLRRERSARLPDKPHLRDIIAQWRSAIEARHMLQTRAYEGGSFSRGEIRGRPVDIHITEGLEGARILVRITLPEHPLLDALEVVGRGDEETEVPLPDPILQQMIRVSGVSAEDAIALLGDLHGPLFDVLRSHEDSRVGGGCVIHVADTNVADATASAVDAVLEPALALAEALAEAAVQTSQDTGSTPGM